MSRVHRGRRVRKGNRGRVVGLAAPVLPVIRVHPERQVRKVLPARMEPLGLSVLPARVVRRENEAL